MEIYDRAAVRVNGRYVAHSTTVKLSYHANDEITTLLGGGTQKVFCLAPDTRLVRIQWDMVVPTTTTQDLQFIRQFLDVERVKVGIDMFGSLSSLNSEGFLQEPTLSGRVGSNLEYAVSFIGTPASF